MSLPLWLEPWGRSFVFFALDIEIPENHRVCFVFFLLEASVTNTMVDGAISNHCGVTQSHLGRRCSLLLRST
jgi:hypothetical protein